MGQTFNRFGCKRRSFGAAYSNTDAINDDETTVKKQHLHFSQIEMCSIAGFVTRDDVSPACHRHIFVDENHP